jgi:hypothetical protein
MITVDLQRQSVRLKQEMDRVKRNGEMQWDGDMQRDTW